MIIILLVWLGPAILFRSYLLNNKIRIISNICMFLGFLIPLCYDIKYIIKDVTSKRHRKKYNFLNYADIRLSLLQIYTSYEEANAIYEIYVIISK